MKNNTRLARINDEILKELSQILRTEVKDPRIGAMTTIIRVDTTQDLKYARIYVSVLGNEDEKKSVMQGLKNASGFIRGLIAKRVNLRFTPELQFKLDESTEYAVHMNQLINEISSDLAKKEADGSFE